MKKGIIITTVLILISTLPLMSSAQTTETITQTIRGTVTDEASGAPIPYAAVVLPEHPGTGTLTDENGHFQITRVPLGRHTIEAVLIGYEPAILRELLVTSGKEVSVQIAMRERVTEIEEIVIRPRVNKEEALNPMAVAGAKMLSMEEARRYAGGMDDPGRLVGSFAGVSSDVSHNGISIHGNSPHMLQWRLEDVEIPNPNHYADISTLGGGILSSLSSHVLGNSDFFTGAFPAEYANAVSGVFDMRMRTGNNFKHENTFQVGVLGIDVASEGPFSKNSNASYLFNYRYSTLGLMGKLDKSVDLGGELDYQDLNFKLNFPTAKAGTFSVWGTGLIDKFSEDFDRDPADWHTQDNFIFDSKQYMGAGGLSHRYFFTNRSSLKTTLAMTWFKHDAFQISHDTDLNPSPYMDLSRRQTNLVLTSAYNHKFGPRHTNKTGFTYTRINYHMNMDLAPAETQPLETISKGDGQTDLINLYTQSAINLSDRLTFNIGITTQMLTLNNDWTIEPRAGVKWQAGRRSTLALAYGLHSRMEKMDVYFVRDAQTGSTPNEKLGFMQAHHLMFTYGYKLSDNLNLRIEPYYQHLFDIPVERGSSFAVINRTEYYAEAHLVNSGKGRNYGVDITLEKYLTRGFYYMATASLFDSRYRGGDRVWRPTRYNRGYIFNGLIGKEWPMGRGKKNTLSANVKFTYQGGERYTPSDEQATLAHPDKDVQYDETRAFTRQYPDMFVTHLSAGYRINRPQTSHEFSVMFLNLTRTEEYHGYHFNLQQNKIERNATTSPITNIAYKIHF